MGKPLAKFGEWVDDLTDTVAGAINIGCEVSYFTCAFSLLDFIPMVRMARGAAAGMAIVRWDHDIGHATITVINSRGEALTTGMSAVGRGNPRTGMNGLRTRAEIENPVDEAVSRTFELPDADAAMNAQKASLLRDDLGPYNDFTNNCVTYCIGILQAGGLDEASVTWLYREFYYK